MFANTRGNRQRQDGWIGSVFARICHACRITGHSLYDLRSTFATTHWMEDYARLPWVSQTIGYKHHETTQRHYFKYTPNARVKGFANQIRKAK